MNDFSYMSAYSDVALLKAIGEFIKARRIELNITQDEVAVQATISRSTFSMVERGEKIYR